MRPTAEEVLRGIRANLLTIVLPTIEDPYARTQVQMMALQLEAVAGQWDGDAGRQSTRNGQFAELLLSCADALVGHPVNEGSPDWAALAEATITAVKGADAVELTLSSIYARQTQLSEALSAVLVAFEQIAAHEPRAEILDLRRGAYALLREQLSGS